MFEIRKYTYKCVLNPVANANRSETLSFPSDPSGARCFRFFERDTLIFCFIRKIKLDRFLIKVEHKNRSAKSVENFEKYAIL